MSLGVICGRRDDAFREAERADLFVVPEQVERVAVVVACGGHGVHGEEEPPDRESPFYLPALLPVLGEESDGAIGVVGVLVGCFAHGGANVLEGHVR